MIASIHEVIRASESSGIIVNGQSLVRGPGGWVRAAAETSPRDEGGAPHPALRIKAVLLRALDLAELGAHSKIRPARHESARTVAVSATRSAATG